MHSCGLCIVCQVEVLGAEEVLQTARLVYADKQ